MSTMRSIPWLPQDLTILWPLHDLSASLPMLCKSQTTIEGRDNFGGLQVVEKSKFESIIRTIPEHYGNQLSVICSRIMHLQACYALLKRYRSREHQATLERFKDSCCRNLIFTCNVRQEFYEEVAREFYGKDGTPIRNFSQQDSTFRSTTLDSWLYVEFNLMKHAPPTYSEVVSVQKHPKDITGEGNLSLQPFDSCLILILDWLVWAEQNHAEWLVVAKEDRKKESWRFLDDRAEVPTKLLKKKLDESLASGLEDHLSKEVVDQAYAIQVR